MSSMAMNSLTYIEGFSVRFFLSVDVYQLCKKNWKIPKWVIKIRKYNGRQLNGQMKKDKQRSTKNTHKIKYRVTPTSLRTGVNSGAPERYAVPAPLVAPVN